MMGMWHSSGMKLQERSRKEVSVIYTLIMFVTNHCPQGLNLILYPSKLHFSTIELFAYADDLKGHDLPHIKRSKGESDVYGIAVQAFNIPADQSTMMPGYITGNLVLPPRGIKDAEGVGICAQVFNVVDCQPKSIEVAIADPETNNGKFESKSAQRFLLSKGEQFHVPPGNIYRIENHSKRLDCMLMWTIIRPMKQNTQNI